jgi:hypothetical protein
MRRPGQRCVSEDESQNRSCKKTCALPREFPRNFSISEHSVSVAKIR